MSKVIIEGKEVDLDSLSPEQVEILKDKYSEAFLPAPEPKGLPKRGKRKK